MSIKKPIDYLFGMDACPFCVPVDDIYVDHYEFHSIKYNCNKASRVFKAEEPCSKLDSFRCPLAVNSALL